MKWLTYEICGYFLRLKMSNILRWLLAACLVCRVWKKIHPSDGRLAAIVV